ncbi:MAG: esterase family protein [Gemmataceae bacterium]|nr:esterase family protein [Gemmataceae bacterium]
MATPVRWAVAACFLLFISGETRAGFYLIPPNVHRVNRKLYGQVLDYTANNGEDRRMWSAALSCKRDLYIYLPPCFDPAKRYPLAIFLHGATQDEQFFLEYPVQEFDRAIATGKLPPIIIAAPDGSLLGRPSMTRIASFFANSRAGNFEDFVMQDVWGFLHSSFPIRPDRESHGIVGVSMGGGAAYALGMKYRDRVKMVVGFFPVLNTRWEDCHGRYRADFDPNCWGWRSEWKPLESMGRSGVFALHQCNLYGPVAGRGDAAIAELSRINPIEIMDRVDLRDGELDLYVAYGGKDEFNIDAQIESFLYRAWQRRIQITVDYDPHGRHDATTGLKMLPAAIDWAARRMAGNQGR